MGRSSFFRKLQHNWNGDLNFEKFFSYREKYRTTTSRLKRIRYGHYCTKIQNKFGASIPMTADFDRSVYFPHGIAGIFISVGAKIGKNCTILQQVTIGSNTLGDSQGEGVPVIGDNVFIGAGAKIIGGVHVGNNVRIGANCVVVKDVPDNATVVLQAPRVLLDRGERDNTFKPVQGILSLDGET